LDEVPELHAEQLDLYGGPEGVLSPEHLESAVAAPAISLDGE
jgi:hypothetical protein